jgi:ABC-2 type transport system permease protein
MRSSLSFLAAQIGMSLKASMALRAAFWMQVVLMVLNDLLFFCVWWIFFARYPVVRGWTLHDMYAGYGFVALAFGLYAVLAGGTRDLAQRIVLGDLDVLLTQPRALLPRLALSKSNASAWGDIAFGILLLSLSGLAGGARIPALIVLTASSALVLMGATVLVNSLAFWLGEMDGLPRQLTEFVLIFSLYPSPIFTGALRLVLFTLVPAGFVGFLPAEFLHEPSAGALLGTLGGALLWTALAVLVFHRGLRRYESGNRISVNA